LGEKGLGFGEHGGCFCGLIEEEVVLGEADGPDGVRGFEFGGFEPVSDGVGVVFEFRLDDGEGVDEGGVFG
jgi:hypothetical protein